MYADSLSEFGTARLLPRSSGWIIERRIPHTSSSDAMGCYPMFACQDWSRLGSDLAELEGRLVSLALVADPFSGLSQTDLSRLFDNVVHFKDHYLIRLEDAPESYVTPHHRYYARKAFRSAHVEYCERPLDYLDEWADLYDTLIARHGLRGIKAFSRAAFATQLAVPGIVMLRVVCNNIPIGAHLWYRQGDVAYSHLMAVNDTGYMIGAAYALYSAAIEHFRKSGSDQVRWLNLGAGAGMAGDAADGLSKFKKGWSNAVRPAYFCGRVLDHKAYAAIVASCEMAPTSYFPAYRHGELA